MKEEEQQQSRILFAVQPSTVPLHRRPRPITSGHHSSIRVTVHYSKKAETTQEDVPSSSFPFLLPKEGQLKTENGKNLLGFMKQHVKNKQSEAQGLAARVVKLQQDMVRMQLESQVLVEESETKRRWIDQLQREKQERLSRSRRQQRQDTDRKVVFVVYRCVNLHLYSCINIHIHVFMCIHLFNYSYIFIYIHMYSHVFIYIHIYSHVFIYIHMYSYIFIYFHLLYLSIRWPTLHNVEHKMLSARPRLRDNCRSKNNKTSNVKNKYEHNTRVKSRFKKLRRGGQKRERKTKSYRIRRRLRPSGSFGWRNNFRFRKQRLARRWM